MSPMRRPAEGRRECQVCRNRLLRYPVNIANQLHSRHTSRKHNPNVEYHHCQEYGCEYSTQKKADLRRHARAKHPHDVDSKPFKCYLCGVGSNRKDNLKRHEATCTRNALNRVSSRKASTSSQWSWVSVRPQPTIWSCQFLLS